MSWISQARNPRVAPIAFHLTFDLSCGHTAAREENPGVVPCLPSVQPLAIVAYTRGQDANPETRCSGLGVQAVHPGSH